MGGSRYVWELVRYGSQLIYDLHGISTLKHGFMVYGVVQWFRYVLTR